MKQAFLTVTENIPLVPGVFRMRLSGDAGELFPGQFVNVGLDGLFLRRPISVCFHEGNELTLIYKTVGKGTEALSQLRPGAVLDTLCGLGRGYDTEAVSERALLVGGGVGVPPLYFLAKTLIDRGKSVSVILGFNTAGEVFYEDEFRALGCDVTVTTADGSKGIKGFVTAALPVEADHFFACGPLPMLKALCKATDMPGQLSLEERMGCGFGACMGCSIQTANGPKRICREGPVFRREELLW